jgi:cystathionine beta-lyase/cystathionine gamma-synthase
LRFSIGIENRKDIIADLQQAFDTVAKDQLQKTIV